MEKRWLLGRGVEEAIEHTRYENGRKMIGAEGYTGEAGTRRQGRGRNGKETTYENIRRKLTTL